MLGHLGDKRFQTRVVHFFQDLLGETEKIRLVLIRKHRLDIRPLAVNRPGFILFGFLGEQAQSHIVSRNVVRLLARNAIRDLLPQAIQPCLLGHFCRCQRPRR